MAEDIVDCVSHVVDVCLRVDLFTVSVDHNSSLSLLDVFVKVHWFSINSVTAMVVTIGVRRWRG